MNSLQLKDHWQLGAIIALALGLQACAPVPMTPVATDAVALEAYPEPNNNYVEPNDQLYYDEATGEYYTETPVPDNYQPLNPMPAPIAPPAPIPAPAAPTPRPAPVAVAPKPVKKPPVVNTIIAESSTRPLQDLGSVQVETLDLKRPTVPAPSSIRPTPVPSNRPLTTTPSLTTERTTRTDTPAPARPVVAPRNYPLSPAAASLLESARNEASRNNLGRAGELIERALRIEPNNPNLWMQLAQFRKQQGDNAQAVAMAKKAAQVQPDDQGLERQAWSFIAGIYRATGNQAGLAEAMSYL